MGEIGHVHSIARGIVVILHNLDHLVATVVDLDKGEADATLGKLSHLVLDLEAIR